MSRDLWMPSYPDAVAYEVAALVAPTSCSETFLLQQAWIALERAEERYSELDLSRPLGPEDFLQ